MNFLINLLFLGSRISVVFNVIYFEIEAKLAYKGRVIKTQIVSSKILFLSPMMPVTELNLYRSLRVNVPNLLNLE